MALDSTETVNLPAQAAAVVSEVSLFAPTAGVTDRLDDKRVPVGAVEAMADACSEDKEMYIRLKAYDKQLNAGSRDLVTLGEIVGWVSNQIRAEKKTVSVDQDLPSLLKAMSEVCGVEMKELQPMARVATANHAPFVPGGRT